MRVKFTGIENFVPNEEDVNKVKDYVENKLKCRVHEEESLFNNGDTRSGRCVATKSKDW
jgi:hypothetical protein